jgi:hypothetical protein
MGWRALVASGTASRWTPAPYMAKRLCIATGNWCDAISRLREQSREFVNGVGRRRQGPCADREIEAKPATLARAGRASLMGQIAHSGSAVSSLDGVAGEGAELSAGSTGGMAWRAPRCPPGCPALPERPPSGAQQEDPRALTRCRALSSLYPRDRTLNDARHECRRHGPEEWREL